MTGALRLRITTPETVLLDRVVCLSVRAEDETGSFGILSRHADLLTVLPASVVSWRTEVGGGVCAVSAGVLTVTGGTDVSVACRRGVLGESLEALPSDVLERFEAQADEDRRARVEQTRLHAQAVRQLMRYLREDGGSAAGGVSGLGDRL